MIFVKPRHEQLLYLQMCRKTNFIHIINVEGAVFTTLIMNFLLNLLKAVLTMVVYAMTKCVTAWADRLRVTQNYKILFVRYKTAVSPC